MYTQGDWPHRSSRFLSRWRQSWQKRKTNGVKPQPRDECWVCSAMCPPERLRNLAIRILGNLALGPNASRPFVQLAWFPDLSFPKWGRRDEAAPACRPCHVCKPNTVEKWRPKGTRIHPGRFGPPMEWVKELDSPCCLRYYSKLDLGSATVLGCRLTRSDWLLRPKTPAPRTIFFSGRNCTGSVQVAIFYLIGACVFF